MRIRILGTGAAEGWPGLFCACDTCKRARIVGGKNLRTRASIQIDDNYKIDLPPDTFYHMHRYGLDLSKLKCLFVTHSHFDHFSADELDYAQEGFAYNHLDPPLRIYGNAAVVAKLQWMLKEPGMPVEIALVEPFVPVIVDHLTFTPIRAVHAPKEEALNYVIQSGDSTVLYASDTGVYGEETLEYLRAQRLDIAIIECTYGNQDDDAKYHMNFAAVLQLRDDLAKAGAIDANTQIVITHFSHNGCLLHDELEAIAEPEGIAVAYDGIQLGELTTPSMDTR